MRQKKNTQVFKTLFMIMFMGWVVQNVKAQESITAIGATLSQNFNTLTQNAAAYTAWSDNVTLLGWYACTDANAALSQIKANNGANTTASLYSFGSAGVADRALGFFPSDAFTGSGANAKGYMGWRLKNNTGKNIGTIRVTWTGEQWRKAVDANIQYIRLSYQVGAAVGSLTAGTYTTTSSEFASPIHNAGVATTLDGNAAANRTAGITIDINVKIPAGQEIMLRWEDTNDPANHTLAIDDVSFVAVKEAQSITFDALPQKTYGNAPFSLTAVASSGLTVAYSSSNTSVATISGSTLTITGAGTSNIIATQAGNVQFAPADQVEQLLTVKPQAPVAVTASDITTQGFTANWNSASGATSYYLYVSTDPSFLNPAPTISAVGNVLLSNIPVGLEPGTTYYYKVKSYNSGVYSDYSNVIPVTTTAGIQTYNITASPTFTTATLNWSNGNLDSRAVFVKEGIGAITVPTDGIRYYESTDWSSPGDELGSSGYYCVYYGSGSSVDLTNLYPGRTYTVQAFEFNGGEWNENYLTSVTGANNPITFVPWPTTTWTNTNGVSTAENWNTAARWDHNTVPTAALHPAVLVYIDGNCQVTDAAECNNLTIKASHASITPKLSINTAKSLNVVGSLTNSGTSAALVVRSASGVANGSLTYGSGTPSGTVEMYTKSYMTVAPPSDHQNKWQFFGIPVNSVTVGNSFSGYPERVRKYDETNKTSSTAHPEIADYGLWKPADALESKVGESTTMTAGQTLIPVDGYEVVQPSPKTYSFSGVLNHSDYSKVLAKTPGADWAGFHIIANPFPASINISGLNFESNLDAAVYIYNAGSRADWENNNGNGTDGVSAGQYVASNGTLSGVLGIPAEIPSMQGFCVFSNGNTNNTIGIPYSSVITNNTSTTIQRISNKVKSEKVGTRIDVIGANYADKMWLFTEPTCTRTYDNGFDGYKLFGSPLTPQIYAMESDDNYQIDAVNDVNNTYLGFNAGLDTNLKLVFTHQNVQSYYGSIYLVDLVANKTIDITTSGTEYAFSTVANSTTKRFKIITSTTKVDSPEANNTQVKIFGSQAEIFVQNNSDLSGNVVLYNMTGMVIRNTTLSANGLTTLSNIPAGAYIVKAKTNREEVTQRLIIR